MVGFGSGNAVFDAPFFVLQLATMAIWVVALFTVRWQRRFPWRWGAALSLAILSALVLPAIWNIEFAPVGFEKGARVVTGSPCIIVNGFLSCLWANASAADAIQSKWPTVRPLLITACLGLVAWLLFWT